MRFYINHITLTIFFLALSTIMLAQDKKDSVEIHFRQGYSTLDMSLGKNQEMLNRITDSLAITNTDSIYNIKDVTVVGGASPEGSIQLNKRLSEKRANVLFDYLSKYTVLLPSSKHFVYLGRDWNGLLQLVRLDDNVPYQDEVIALLEGIVQNIVGGEKAADANLNKLINLRNGEPYIYIYKVLFPRLRASRMLITYEKVWNPISIVVPPFDTQGISTVPREIGDSITLPIPMQDQIEKTYIMNVRSNMLGDVLLVPNIGIEYYINNRYSVAANYSFAWWSTDAKHRYMQVIDGELEFRRYFKADNTHSGHYLSVYGHGNLYDFSFDAERAWQGEGWGVGLGYGYVWQPWKNKRWKIEAFMCLGYYHSVYDPYHAGDPYKGKYYYDWDGPVENFLRRNHRLRWLGPTRAGVTISFDLFKTRKR